MSKGTRWSLLKSPEKQTIDQLAKLAEVQQANQPLYRAFLLKEELRVLYQLEDPALAPAHLDAWLSWASRSRLEPFIKLARTIRRHRDGILNAIRLGLNNGRLEGLNSRIRLSATAASASTPPPPSSPSSTSAAPTSPSSYRDDTHHHGAKHHNSRRHDSSVERQGSSHERPLAPAGRIEVRRQSLAGVNVSAVGLMLRRGWCPE